MDEEQITEPTVTDATIDAPIVKTEPQPIPDPTIELPITEPAPEVDLIPAEPEIIPVPSPIPEEPPLPPPSPTPDLVPIPEPIREPSLNPIPIPTPTPDPSTLIPIPSSLPATFDVASLSDEQLRAAAILYTKRNQAELSKKGVAKRQEKMELNLREIVDYLSLDNGSPLPRIAKNTNITPGTTSKYLRQLIASDKVRAEGWAKTRRYYLK